jgi:hypothetical protein
MGKASLLMVLGFSLVFAIVSPSLNRTANRSTENYLHYVKITQAHDIATSAANIAANQVFLDPKWRSGYTDVPFSGGKFDVSAQNYGTNQIKIIATGEFESYQQNVTVILQPSSFAKFAYYSKVEGSINWITGDTIWGPFHTQAKMNIPWPNSPVFYGKVSTLLGTNPKKNLAKFYGGYQSGVNLDLPGDISGTVNAAKSSGRVFATGNLWLTFNLNNVTWKTSATGTETTEPLSTFASNGVILVEKGNLHVQGTMRGKATVCATGSASLGYGNIIIDDDVRYETDPRIGASNDMLGLVAQNNAIVTDNTANRSDCRIDASIFCLNGGLTAENYSTRPLSGTLTLLGGITQYQRGAVGTFSGTTLNHGFHKNYRYDDRLMMMSPPAFPLTGSYEIISWLEE